MGLFKRKKKVAAADAVSVVGAAPTGAGDSAGISDAAAGGGAVPDEMAAVLSAAVRAYEADSISSFAGSPAQMELSAVISAAIAAYEGGGTALPYIGTGPSGFYVRKLNRNSGFVPAWGVMGNREAIDARRF
jgi:hypothetical protein